MKNKPISQSIIAIALLLILILFISEYPGQGRIRVLGLSISALVIAAGVLMATLFKDQITPIKKLEKLLRNKSRLLNTSYPVLTFLWPFIIYWQLVIPSPLSKTIQNDFIYWYFTYKNYLIASLSHFKIPLWSAAEAGGFPFYSSPLTQTFYPLNLPYALYGYIQGGISILSYQIFTIAGISLFAVGLYFLLCEFKISRFSSFLVSILIPISFRLIETSRFPNAVHTAAWFPWILLIITKLSNTRSIKRAFLSSLSLFLVSIFTVTAGYPYFVYYLIFLIPPYLIILCLPSFRKQLFPDYRTIDWKLFLGSLASTGLISLLALLPYLIKMKQLLGQTTNRAGNELVWVAGRWSSTFFDFIGSVIFPPAANSEGWIYFGIIGLLVIFLFLLASLTRNNTRDYLFSRSLTTFFIIWIVFIVYLSCDGNETPSNILWVLLWKYFPGFSSLRVWARINIILLPLISILLAFALQYFNALLKSKTNLENSSPELILVAAVAAGIILFQSQLLRSDTQSIYWSWMDGGNPANFLYLSLISILILFGLFLYARLTSNPGPYHFIPAFILLILFSIFDAQGGQMSQWIWSGDARAKDLTHIYQPYSANEAFTKPRVSSGIPIPLDGEFNVDANRVSWHYQRYVNFLDRTDDQIEHREKLLGLTDGTRLFFTERIDYGRIEDFISDSDKYKKDIKIDVLEFTGDSLLVRVETPVSGNLSYIDNWDPDWHAYINSTETQIHLLFGTFKSIQIPPGEQIIKFIYKPKY